MSETFSPGSEEFICEVCPRSPICPRGRPYMTSAKFLGFWTPSPPCLHLGLIYSAKFMQPPLLYIFFWAPPSPLCADVIYGCPQAELPEKPLLPSILMSLYSFISCFGTSNQVQSCVKTFLTSFENHPPNFPLFTPKMHYGTIFQPSIPQTCQECVNTTLCSICSPKRLRDFSLSNAIYTQFLPETSQYS